MCGIVGAFGLITQKEERIFQQLLVVDALRGDHSTGVLSVKRGSDEHYIAKAVGNPFDLLDSNAFKNITKGFSRVLLGHNRYATTGNVNKKNAHPFEVGDIIGVHNGTLRNKYQLADSAMFQVDSENFYHHVEKHGLRDAVNIAEGDYCFVWWDTAFNEINFLRNAGRPMWLCTNRSKSAVFFASERWMLDSILYRNDDEALEIYSLPTDMHTRFSISNMGKIEKPVVVEMKQTERNFQQGSWTASGGTKTPLHLVPKKTVVVNNSAEKHIFEIIRLDVDFHGADYAICANEDSPYSLYHLFLKKEQVAQYKGLTGRFIKASVGNMIRLSKNCEYHKLVASSVEIIGEEVDPVGDNSTESDVADNEIVDSKGNQITLREFKKKYGTCNFCDGDVAPNSGFKFTTQDQVFCEDCVSDSGVGQYVMFK